MQVSYRQSAAVKKFPAGAIIALFIGILLAWVSPEESELGSLLKLIYIHGALITAGLSLFTAAGLLSLISLMKNISTRTLLFAIEKTAIIFWIAATVIGDMTSVLVWGGLYWGEPRFNATIIISLLSVSVYFISTASESPKVISFLSIGLAISMWALMLNAGRIMHPDNPFSASEPSIRVFSIMITLVFLAASILTVRWMVKKGT